MDALQTTQQRAVIQWDLYDKVLSAGTKLPVYPVMGNHDVWGWAAKEPLDESVPEYGKAMALDRLKLKRSYYSFDAGGWHLVILDNIARRGGGYYSILDPEQLEWLKADLAANGSTKPVCVFSHIPFFAICPFFFSPKSETLWRVRDNLLYHDLSTILPVFKQGGVKLALSGHIHLGDRVDFDGMTFITTAAVSGNWWGGPFQQFAEGYGVVDLWPDGSFDYRYLNYGWKAEK
jgi:3',5'-cyclic AMP phosphodiesterase CpdA